MPPEPPQNPIGPFTPPEDLSSEGRQGLIDDIAKLPSQLREAVAGLSDAQLDTKYRNWSIRQIVHHLADSHVNSYVRYKWALTEDSPTIKAYDEELWSLLDESQTGDIEPSLLLLEGVHARWVQLLRSMSTSTGRSSIQSRTEPSR